MQILPKSFKKTKEFLAKLPLIGPKGAEKITANLLRKDKQSIMDLGRAILSLSELNKCRECFFITENSDYICDICKNKERDEKTVCVVEDILDLTSIEDKGFFKGKYHVLGGTVRIGQKDNTKFLTTKALITRIKEKSIKEIVIATNPNALGDVTAGYLKEELSKIENLKITRIRRGIPTGGNLEYADKDSLEASINGRVIF